MAKGVVVACGAWTREFIPALKGALTVRRQVLHWYADPDRFFTEDAGFRAFVFHTTDGKIIYGIPSVDAKTFKIAEHTEGVAIADPMQVNRSSSYADRREMNRHVERMFPQAGKWRKSKVCLYTMSPDEHFVIDRHPEWDRVWYMTGESGHAFKFAPVLGEILSKGALGQNIPYDIDLFSASRLARR